MSLRRGAGPVLAGLLATACGSKGAVGITATVSHLSLAMEGGSSLAAQLNGGFDLHLELGQYAPQGTDVALDGNFALVGSDASSLLLLSTYASAVFPYHLEPGGSSDVHFTIGDKQGTPGQLITMAKRIMLCQAGTAGLAGKITDSAAGNQGTPLSAPPVPVAGCAP
jgi:hypothetical protein